MENLRPHYARTLWAWSDELEARQAQARKDTPPSHPARLAPLSRRQRAVVRARLDGAAPGARGAAHRAGRGRPDARGTIRLPVHSRLPVPRCSTSSSPRPRATSSCSARMATVLRAWGASRPRRASSSPSHARGDRRARAGGGATRPRRAATMSAAEGEPRQREGVRCASASGRWWRCCGAPRRAATVVWGG